MKKQDINALKILGSLKREPVKTQRDLAAELDISLGMANKYTKQLVQKGYLRVVTIARNRKKYIVTTKGLEEKNKLTGQYLLNAVDLYKEIRSKMQILFEKLSNEGKKRIFIIGANELTEIAIISIRESKLKLAGVIDDERADTKILDVSVKNNVHLNQALKDDALIITNERCKAKMMETVKDYISIDSIIDIDKTVLNDII